APKINVIDLAAINADLGTVTAGTVRGLLIETDSAPTTGIKMDNTSLRGYDGAGVKTFELIRATGIITSVGMEAQAIKNIENFTTGEDITDGDIVCLKPNYTDYLPSDDAYTDQRFPDNNYGSAAMLRLHAGTNFKYSFIKFDMTRIALPNIILKAELRMMRFETVGGVRNIDIKRVGHQWAEGTITWNNQPHVFSDIGTTYGMETFKPVSVASTWVVWDITQLVRHWKDGTIMNFGIRISSNVADLTSFDSKESTFTDERPVLRIYSVQESDGKVYKANCADYLLSRSIVGVAQESKLSGNMIKIQTVGQITNMGGALAGGIVYLSNSPGLWTSLTTNLNRIIKLGKITSAGKAILNVQQEDILIEKLYQHLSATSTTRRFYVPSDARYAVVHIEGGTGFLKKVFHISRDADGLTNWTFAEPGGAPQRVSFNWDVANNFLEITANRSEAYIRNIYFYT
ncbi:MAG: DNRLRE domain-containing protein, partial [Clostridiales bacterium]|nr:DNRLRE domain-containing protein [Clostridiales bacterium]